MRAPLRSSLFPYTTLFRSDLVFIPGNATPPSSTYSISGRVNGSVATLTLSGASRSEEHTSELQSRFDLVCRLLLEKKTLRAGAVGRRAGSSAAPLRSALRR